VQFVGFFWGVCTQDVLSELKLWIYTSSVAGVVVGIG
jgi:hypothetical protein